MTDTKAGGFSSPVEVAESRNLAVVQRFIDGAVNGHDAEVIDETWSTEISWNGGSLGTHRTREEFKAALASAQSAFSSMQLTIHDTLTDGDKVAVRFTNSGTNTGTFMANPATGKHAEWLGIGIYTVHDGRITEGWFAEDIFGLVRQLGAIPTPA